MKYFTPKKFMKFYITNYGTEMNALNLGVKRSQFKVTVE